MQLNDKFQTRDKLVFILIALVCRG